MRFPWELEDFLEQISDRIELLEQRTDTMATQADVDALTASLDSGVAAIQAELDTLAAANPTLDLTALTAEVAKVATLTPTPPAPPAVRTRYQAAPGTTIDAVQWPSAPAAADGTPLYYFAGDVNPGDKNGATVPGWTVYTGP